MKRRFLYLLPAVLLSVHCAGVPEPETVADAGAGAGEEMAPPVASDAAMAPAEARTLNGEFEWTDRTTGALEAVFTPTGEDEWDVSFHFTFRDEPHTYTGKAQGNLVDGDLSGRVQNEKRNRTWTFSGSFDDAGTFRGDHIELRGGGERPTGTLWLSS